MSAVQLYTPRPLIHAWSPESLGYKWIFKTVSAPGTTLVWPSANLAIYIPFQIPAPATVVKLWWCNGNIVSGNVDCGIYKEDGTYIISTGATAQAGVSSFQSVDITDTTLPGPARYYFALSCSSATARIAQIQPTDPLNQHSWGTLQEAAAHPLPTTSATFAANTTRNIGLYGLAFRTTVS